MRPQRVRIYCNPCAGKERVVSNSQSRTGLTILPPVRQAWARRTGPAYVCECCGADVTRIICW